MLHTKSKPEWVDNNSFISTRGVDLFTNLGLFVLMWLAYSAGRTLSADQLGVALDNAKDVLRAQEALGLPSELKFQQKFLGRTELLRAANIYYIAIHFPATIAFVYWVWHRHREKYARVRNTLISSAAVGVTMHILYPLAPPRMLEGFVDTGAVFGPDPWKMRISASANQIAAMPSLHVGWAILVALAAVWILKSRWRWLALAHPIGTAVVVVVTANHYWADAIVATILVLGAWAFFGNDEVVNKWESYSSKLFARSTS